jgi:peptidoglycan/xylan/chitin deacetylase (PgdA/CDA1 family)
MSAMKNLPGLVILLLAVMIFCFACEKKEMASAPGHLGELIWHGDPSSNKIYLTFDDGPNTDSTPKILDILKAGNVKATFFILGRKAKAYPEIVKRIYLEGHSLGNHTFSHVGGLNAHESKILKEIKGTDKAIKAGAGVSPKFFRPPFGFFNYRYFEVAEKMGYKTVLWTYDVGDWNTKEAGKLENEVLSQAKGGAIILLHDGGKNREELIKALPNIILKLKRSGLKLKALSELYQAPAEFLRGETKKQHDL